MTSDSLAAESLHNDGSFGAGNPKAAASKQPSASTTTNTTDTSSATKLNPAPTSEDREKQSGGGAIGFSGSKNAQAQPSGGATGNGASAPSGVVAGMLVPPETQKPKGTKLKEGDFDKGRNDSGTTDIGNENDPARVAENELLRHNAAPSGGNPQAGTNKESVYEQLEREANA